MKQVLLSMSVLVILFAACDGGGGDNGGGGVDTIPAEDTVPAEDAIPVEDMIFAEDTTGGAGVFGDPCADPEDCESGTCHEFGQPGWLCTLECGTSDECPEGSEGQKCNQQGVCRP